MENDYSKLTSLETIKEFCNSHLFDIATGVLRAEKHSVKVRFIDLNGEFGVTGLGRFFFVDDCMYVITKDKKYKTDHNSDILKFSKELDFLNYTGEFVVSAIFAGIFTGFYDDKGERIFTGDVVSAKVLINPTIPSVGGASRARNLDSEEKGSFCEAGIDEMLENYSLILDNHSIPLSWATELEIIGSLFFDLKKGETEIDICALCSSFAQSRTDKSELRKLIQKSPYFPPVTWQEKAIELLCGTNKDENGKEY